ncbi:hypothetical protein JCM10213_002744 [Rhodosporidiobolus nylandii]
MSPRFQPVDRPCVVELAEALSDTDRRWVDGLAAHFERAVPGAALLAPALWNAGYRSSVSVDLLARRLPSSREGVLRRALGGRLPPTFASFPDLVHKSFRAMSDFRALLALEQAVYHRPAPRCVAGVLEYVVDRIVGEKTCPATGVKLFRVAWQGYAPSERTWEVAKDLQGTDAVKRWTEGASWACGFRCSPSKKSVSS